MTDTAAPDGLVLALRAAGLRLAGPVGRGSGGPRWSAVDEEGRRWTVTVVDTGSARGAGEAAERVRRLGEISHDHLPRHREPLTLLGGRLAVLQEEVPGADLATVCAARGTWAPAEVVTVLVPLAGALAALHAQGLAHGDVSPANVVLRPDGRAVLVDLICGDGPGEGGTPGVAAPERPSGARAPGDVHALARLGLRMLDPAQPGGRHPATDVDVSSGREAVVACLQVAASSDPSCRPAASDLAASLYRACRPAPVDVPDAAVLARAALRRLAEPPSAELSTWVRPRARRERGRHRRTRRRGTALVVGTTVLVLASAVTLPAALGERSRQPGDEAGRGPAAAAVRLTLARADALASGDVWALRAITVPGSRAAAADAVTAWVVRANGPAEGTTAGTVQRAPSVEQPPVQVLAVQQLPPGVGLPGRQVTACAGCARVMITARFTPPRDGARTALSNERAVVLVLRSTWAGWRVVDVEPPPG